MSDNYEKVRQVLKENGIDPDGTEGPPHSWRCEFYYEKNGPCLCVAYMIEDILKVLELDGG